MTRRDLWVAAALRLPLLFFAGHPTDVQTFLAWANRLHRVGPWGFYEFGVFADYTPGYLLVLWPVGALTAHWPHAAAWLIKLVPAAADFAAAAALANLAAPAGPNVARVFLFSPAVLFIGAFWGQAESVAVAWVLAGMACARRGAVGWAGALIGFGLLTKPQYLAAAPLALGFAARVDGLPPRRLLVGVAAAAAAIVVPAALFRLWPWDLAAHVLRSSGVYPYASVNALNLWHALGGNWKPDHTPVLGVPLSIWSITFTAIAVLAALAPAASRPDAGSFYLATAAVFAAVYFLAPRMHERYLFPAYPFLLLAWSWGGVGYGMAAILSFLLTANLVYGFAYIAQFPEHQHPLWSAVWRAFSPSLTATLSLIGVAMLAALLVAQRARLSPQGTAQPPQLAKRP